MGRMTRKTATERGYGHRWHEARNRFLQANPLCVMCKRLGRVTAASVVDHIIPHKGNLVLFWDEGNWQSLCRRHHNSDKKIVESRGYMPGVDANGDPIDADHPWNK